MNTKTQQPAKICFVSPKAYPLLNPDVQSVFGGAEVDLFLLGTELAKDTQYQVSFITADYGQPDKEIRNNITIYKSLNFQQNSLSSARKIWKALKKADADLYLIKTFSPGVPLLYYFCKAHHRKFLYRTAHQHECDGTCRKQKLLLGWMFDHVLRKADAVFTQNQADQENLKKTAQVESIMIPNGHLLDPVPQSPRESILWVGRSADFKHPERFLDLAKQFPDESFVMICRQATEDTQHEQLKQQAQGILNLQFHSNVEFSQIYEFFARAKVLINTSDSEGFANTFIQAAQTATAILTWSVNPDQFISQYDCGLPGDGSMEKMTENLRFLLEDQQYIQKGQNARRYVERHHEITKIIEQYKELFHSMQNQRSASS